MEGRTGASEKVTGPLTDRWGRRALLEQLHESVVGRQLRVVEDLGRAPGRRPPHPLALEALGPDVEGLGGDDLVQDGDDLGPVPAQRPRTLEARIVGQTVAAERPQDLVQVAVGLEAGEEEPTTILRAVRVHEWRLVGTARLGRRHFAQVRLEAEVPTQHIRPRAQQRHLDDAPTARRALLQHGGEQPRQGGESADVVPDPAAGIERDALAVGQLHRQARAGPEGTDVVGGAVAVVATQAVPAHAPVDKARVALHGGRGLETECVECVGAQVGHEDVGRCQELLEPLPGLHLAQVEHDAALAPIVLREGRVGGVAAADAQRAERVAHRVTRGRFHLDDVGAPVGQQRRRRGRGDPDAELDHAQAGQRREALGGVGGGHRGVPEVATRARSASFNTLPVALRGSSSTISTARGTL